MMLRCLQDVACRARPLASLSFQFRAFAELAAGQNASPPPLRPLSGLVPGDTVHLIDTMALAKRLEGNGITQQQAEAVTGVVSEVIRDAITIISHSYVSQENLHKNEMLNEAALSKFKDEVKTSQDHRFSKHHQIIERLSNDVEKLRSELRYEIDKAIASQRLDMNLEKGRTREELSDQKEETSNLTNKLDKEIQALQIQFQAAKSEVIKYCIGTVVSITALGLGLIRIFK